MSGWIKLHRSIIDNPMYFSEPFTRIQAWTDLLLIANHKKGYIYCRGNKVELKRGDVGYGQVKLAERWKWSRGKVIRFLNELEKEQQIVQQKNNVTSIISIVNYNEYQDNDTAESTLNDTPNGQQTGQQTDSRQYTNKNNKNYISIYLKGENRLIFESLNPLMNEMLEDQCCIEDFQRISGKPYPTAEAIQEKIKEFFVKLTVDGEHSKERKDAIYHFKSWINGEKQQSVNNKTKPNGKEAIQQPIGAGINFIRTNATASR